MKKYILIGLFATLLAFSFSFLSKEAAAQTAPLSATTVSATPSTTSAVLNGYVTVTGTIPYPPGSTGPIDSLTFDYGMTPSSYTNAFATPGSSPTSTSFSLTVTGLTCGTTYSFRADVGYDGGSALGSNMSFTTLACTLVPPTVNTISASVSGTSAILYGHLDSFGSGPTGATATSASVAFMLDGSPVASSTPTVTSLTNFNTAILTFPCGTTHSFYATATTTGGPAVSSLVPDSFTMAACPVLPTVHTLAATVSGTTVTLNGHLDSFGSYLGTASTSANVAFMLDGSPVASSTPTITSLSNFSGTTTVTCGAGMHSYYATAMTSAGAAVTDLTPMTFSVPCPVAIPPTVTIDPVSGISTSSATFTGQMTSAGTTVSGVAGGSTTSSYFSYSNTTATGTYVALPAVSGSYAVGAPFTYTLAISSASCGHTYYIEANIVNSAGSATSSPVSFTVPPCTPVPPTVSMTSATYVGTTATLTGKLLTLGSGTSGTPSTSLATAVGFTNGTSPIAATPSSETTAGTTFTATYTVTCGTTYSFNATASNTNGSATSPTPAGFTTAACPPVVTPLTVVTTGATAIAPTSATFNGYISATSGASATMVGYNYNTVMTTTTSLDPYISESGTFGALSFPMTVTGLTCDTLYHFRAWATNSLGTFYGADMTVTTAGCTPVPPTVSMTSATYVGTTATLTGKLLTLGSGTSGTPSTSLATAVGFTNGTSPIAATPSSETTAGTTFTATYTVTCGTTYSFNATASNTNGSATSPTPAGFTTAACPPASVSPTVTTDPATAVASATATLNGTLNTTGSLSGVSSGPDTLSFVYGTAAGGPYLLSAPATIPSSGTGTAPPVVPFSANLTGLTPCTEYYFEAEAEDGAGTSTGTEDNFTTTCPPPPPTIVAPTVVTNPATAITTTTAIINGTVTSLGGDTSATTDFSASGGSLGALTPTSVTTAPTSFSAPLTGLTCATTYTFTATATNSVSTGSGSTLSFTTSACPPTSVAPTVVTNPATGITTTSAVFSGTMTSGGITSTGVAGGNPTTAGFYYRKIGATTLSTIASSSVPYSIGTPFTRSVTGITIGGTVSGGLLCGTNYEYEAEATNSASTGGTPTFGPFAYFTTLPCNPSVTTTSGTLGTSGVYTFTGNLASFGLGATSASVWFAYGPTTAYGTTTTPVSTTTLGTFTATATIAAGIGCPGWHLQAYAENSNGVVVPGGDIQFCQ